jgi:hypothetical protein
MISGERGGQEAGTSGQTQRLEKVSVWDSRTCKFQGWGREHHFVREVSASNDLHGSTGAVPAFEVIRYLLL